MKIIDMRVRAPFKAYENCNLFQVANPFVQKGFCESNSPSAEKFSMELLLQEAAEANVEKMVVPVRKALDGKNEDLAELLGKYPNELIGLAGIDTVNVPNSIAEIEQFVTEGPCQGIIMEPGQDKVPWHVNENWVYPIYDYCEKHNIPIFLTYGGVMIKSLRHYSPEILDDVAGAFPKLRIGLAHGGLPYVTEVCHIALNRQNVYIAPDFYMIESAGMYDYISAASYNLKHRMMFASAYPLAPIKFAADYYMNCGVKENALPYLMHDNAVEFLGL